MKPSWGLTEEEKQNGKRVLLIPSSEIQAKMTAYERQDFTRAVGKAIQPVQSPAPKAR